MKGIIFNLLENFVTENFGEEKLNAIMSACPLHTKEPFVGPGTYPDSDLLKIVEKTVEKLGITAPEALRAFGKYCFPKLANKFPAFVTPYSHPKDFLKTVESIIHVEVRKLMRGAVTPKFTYQDLSPDTLSIRYDSKRSLCHFMEGLIDGVADHYKSPIKHRQTACKLNGSGHCDFELTFAAPDATIR